MKLKWIGDMTEIINFQFFTETDENQTDPEAFMLEGRFFSRFSQRDHNPWVKFFLLLINWKNPYLLQNGSARKHPSPIETQAESTKWIFTA